MFPEFFECVFRNVFSMCFRNVLYYLEFILLYFSGNKYFYILKVILVYFSGKKYYCIGVFIFILFPKIFIQNIQK